MKLLLVEDDPTLQQALLRLLRLWGYAASAVDTARDALLQLERESFDLMLLDLGLPDLDGINLCQTIRRVANSQPLILMLTARDSTTSKVEGLEAGADDYVVKPFDPEVLRARLKALLRRADRPLNPELSCGPLRLRSGDQRITAHGCSVELTRMEALLLEQLLRSQGCACSKGQLQLACADDRRDVGEDALRAHMRNLRQKLCAAGCAVNLIETVYGFGYRLNPSADA